MPRAQEMVTGDEKGVLIAYGCDHLLCDIMSVALSKYGWRIVRPPTSLSESRDVNLVLVFSLHSMAAAVQDVHRACAEHPGSKVVLLGSEIATAELLRFIEAGVVAYVDTRQGLPDLVEAIQMVRDKRSPPNSHITRLVLADIIRRKPEGDVRAIERLTVREKQIVELINTGLSNKEIADSLSIAPNTVKNHVHNLLEKLKVKSRRETAGVETGTSRHPIPSGVDRFVSSDR
jgi:DNA-binding NarL/FixJ family response regulator